MVVDFKVLDNQADTGWRPTMPGEMANLSHDWENFKATLVHGRKPQYAKLN
jgi:hypothetical protein